MVYKDISSTQDGVIVRMQGDIQKEQFDLMASECNSGSCSCECNSGLKDKISSVEVFGSDGDVSLHLKGENIDKEMVSNAMENCNFGASK